MAKWQLQRLGQCSRRADERLSQPLEFCRCAGEESGFLTGGAEISEQFGQQVTAGFRAIDQLMMRIGYRQSGFDDFFAAPVELLLPDRQM